MDFMGTQASIVGEGATSSAPRDGQDVKLRVLLGTPPPRLPYLFSFSFFSDLQLRSVTTHIRDAGRLWVVSDVKEVEVEEPGSEA